jgi:hypothetical protein
MPDIPNRDELERILARKLGGLNRRQLGKLLELMGDPPKIENVPLSFWDDAGKELAQVVTPFSERVYLESAERMLESVPIGVDWSLVNEAASSWARQYSYELVGGINDTSRRAVGQAVANFYDQGLTMGDLRGRLGRIFSPVRADMIAQTEVTRAAAEGEREVVAEIAKEGIRMVEVWQTSNDELVCPICGPRHGKKVGDGWTRNQGPPAHPRCRCWINHEFEKPREERPYEVILGRGADELQQQDIDFVLGEYDKALGKYNDFGISINKPIEIINDLDDDNYGLHVIGKRVRINYAHRELIEKTFVENIQEIAAGKMPNYAMTSTEDVLIHELGHSLEDRFDDVWFKDLKKLYNNSPNNQFPSCYGQDSQFEMLAEGVTRIISGNDFDGKLRNWIFDSLIQLKVK